MDESQMIDKLHSVLGSQKLGVLATNKDGQPHNCLVAVAVTDDLKHLLFCTSRSTRKYRDITTDPRVSLLMDNRSNRESDFNNAVAVTAIGDATDAQGIDKDRLTHIYIERHPYLANFVCSIDNALIRIDVKEYTVSSFTDLWTFRPK